MSLIPPKLESYPYIFKRPESPNSAFFGKVVLNPLGPMSATQKIVMSNLDKYNFKAGKTAPYRPFLQEKPSISKRQSMIVLESIAEGAMGFISIDENNPGVVVKQQQRDSQEGSEEGYQEAQILDFLDFAGGKKEYVPKFYKVESYRTPEVAFPCHDIYMEELDCDLGQVIDSNDIKLDSPLFKQACDIVQFYHKNNVLHGDIKPWNFGLDGSYSSKDFVLKGFDFGNSCIALPGETFTETIPTRRYRAPEMLFNIPYGKKVDIFSLGCLLFDLYTGKALMQFKYQSTSESTSSSGGCSSIEQNQEHLYAFYQRFGKLPGFPYCNRKSYEEYFKYDSFHRTWAFKKPKNSSFSKLRRFEEELREKFVKDGVSEQVGNDFIDLLKNMLEYDPRKRFNADQVVNHPFFKHKKPFPKPESAPKQPARKKMKVAHPRAEKS